MDFFDSNNSDMHTSLKQIKSRIKAEKEIKASAIKMTSSDSCTIKGSGATPYKVTLSSCTCPDFIKNKGKTPCKHIYRLAAELDIMHLPAIDTSCKQEMENLFAIEIIRWKDAFLSGKITAEQYASLLEAFSK